MGTGQLHRFAAGPVAHEDLRRSERRGANQRFHQGSSHASRTDKTDQLSHRPFPLFSRKPGRTHPGRLLFIRVRGGHRVMRYRECFPDAIVLRCKGEMDRFPRAMMPVWRVLRWTICGRPGKRSWPHWPPCWPSP